VGLAQSGALVLKDVFNVPERLFNLEPVVVDPGNPVTTTTEIVRQNVLRFFGPSALG